MTSTTPRAGRVILDPGRLKQHRQRLGLSQEALAQHCIDRHQWVSIASIKRAEGGRPVLLRTARHLAGVFEVDIADLMAPADRPREAPPDGGDEAQRVIRMVVAPAGEGPGAPLAALVAHYGGHLQGEADAGPLEAIFGVPRAYCSDALRSLQCAMAVSDRAAGRLRIGLRIEPWGGAGDPRAGALPAWPEGQASGVRVHRDLAVQLTEHFLFEDTGQPFLRCLARHPGGPLPGGTLVGRHVELGQLASVLAATCTHGTGHLLYLRGLAGMGRTRLCMAFAELARQRQAEPHAAAVLDFGRRLEDDPLGQWLRSLLGLARGGVRFDPRWLDRLEASALPEAQARALRPLLGMTPTTAQAAMAPEARHREIIDALGALIRRRADLCPQLMVIEDLHWAGDDLLSAVAGLVRSTRDAPVAWLLTSRVEQDPWESRLRPRLADVPLSLIELGPLREEEALALSARFADVAPADAALYVARAQGNPLFLTQLLRVHPDPALPASVKHLVRGQLGLLAPRELEALRQAAAIGQRFSLTLLGWLLGRPADDDLDRPVRWRLVRALDADTWQFPHELVRQGIDEGMPAGQRERLHLRLAQHFAPNDPVRQARHLVEARSPLAPEALMRAVEASLAQHRHGEAFPLLRQLAEIEHAPRDEVRCQLLHARACLAQGLLHEARHRFRLAGRAARRDDERIAAGLGLAAILEMLDELDAEEFALQRILPSVRAGQDPARLAEAYGLLGRLELAREGRAPGRHCQLRALEAARGSGSRRRWIGAAIGLAEALYAEGRMQDAHRLHAHCVASSRQAARDDLEADSLVRRATTGLYVGETQASLADGERALELGRELKDRWVELRARQALAWTLFATARQREAAEQVDAALEVARAMGTPRPEALLLESRARVELVAGDHAAARNTLRMAWQLVRRHGLERHVGPWVLGTLALLEASPPARGEALAQGERLLAQGCAGHNHHRFLVTAAEVCLLQGLPLPALSYAQRLEAVSLQAPCAWSQHHARLIRCQAAWLLSPSERVREAARECWEDGGQAGLIMTMPCLALRSRLLPPTSSLASGEPGGRFAADTGMIRLRG
ncbi:ATP-binding protein [Halomonas denitrificans]|uniref:ATP-binding protein n=1 Tax=Halomonas denitrificans TaxID=370769 RepID=UPI0013001B7C|nr:AAA family ATPase [Halomonas denitrificans]